MKVIDFELSVVPNYKGRNHVYVEDTLHTSDVSLIWYLVDAKR